MSRIIKSFNTNWFYLPKWKDKFKEKDFDDSDFEKITLPNTNKTLPFNCFGEKDYQFISCYKKKFTISKKHKNKRVFLDFEGVMNYAEVYLNGKRIKKHKGGYTPFSVEITKYIKVPDDNILVVKVDSRERKNIPPFGNLLDYLTYGGIYREVNLKIVNKTAIEKVFITPTNVLDNPKVKCKINFFDDPETSQLHTEYSILFKNEAIKTGNKKINLKNKETEFRFDIKNLKNIKLWDIDNPNLYTLQLKIYKEDKLIDKYAQKFGFRKAEFKPDGFFLNGNRIELRGLNRHQSFPYVGYAMPERVQKKDADILKKELHLNIVRTSHYPQSKHFLDRCDEIGLLIFEELTGWQHIGGKEWKQNSLNEIKEMITRDYNHPSIILWGVKTNESLDNHKFFSQTNNLARELDMTRQTGGVRSTYRIAQDFLEDVFTINDFTFEGEKPVLIEPQKATGQAKDVPYLISEFCGHLYPTKKYDQEERLEEHTRRHMEVINAAGENDKISGAIGWCAFDYNTHQYFGSGDRICYHGVMDMFRLPKYAAYFYKSQVDPKKEIVLEMPTRWTPGERNIWGKASFDMPVYTNCEKIQLILENGTKKTFNRNKNKFKGLRYPPIFIKDMHKFWGESWGNGKVVGFINHKILIQKEFVKDPIPTKLEVIPDDENIIANGYDCTRIVVKPQDQVGNTLLHLQDVAKISVSGPATLIGPNEISLMQGSFAFWIRSTDQEGEIEISLKSNRFKEEKAFIGSGKRNAHYL